MNTFANAKFFSPDHSRTYLSHAGLETDLIFNRGIDLPGFSSYPLVESESGRALLLEYFAEFVQLARGNGLGVVLDSPTWKANRDRGAELGHTAERIMAANKAALELISECRESAGRPEIILSGQVGPRGDAYSPKERMTIDEAAAYHHEQISVLGETDADIISAFTLAYAEEAAGIALAAKVQNVPVVVSFTVETDGRLPTGMKLSEAIAFVDEHTDNYPAHYLINCAHPDHFTHVLQSGGETEWIKRLNGVVANASRCSHAELDEATELDDGDPKELGIQIGQIKKQHPHFSVFGGCCGTDMRHVAAIAENLLS